MSELVPVTKNEITDVTSSLNFLLSNVSEAEFMQMVLPLVRMLDADKILFLLSNATSEEGVKVLDNIKDVDILNEVAIMCEDDILGAELGSRTQIRVEVLNYLMDKFCNPYHLKVYSANPSADAQFLRRIFDWVVKFRAKDKRPRYKFESDIFCNIAANPNCEPELLRRLVIEAEMFVNRMNRLDKDIEHKKTQYKEKNKYYWDSDWERTPIYKKLKAKLDEAKEDAVDWFEVILNVASNPNTNPKLLEELFNKYRTKSVHNLYNEEAVMAMMGFFGQANPDTLGYRVLTNPSCDPSFRAKHLNDMVKENRSVYKTGGSGEEYEARIEHAKSPEALLALHSQWVKEDNKDKLWNFGHLEFQRYLQAMCKNPLTPSKILNYLTKRACDKYAYYEFMGPLAQHPNLTTLNITKLVNRLLDMESNQGDYITACLNRVIFPLCNHLNISNKSAAQLFDMCTRLGKEADTGIIILAGNENVGGLDEKFANSKLTLARINFADRCNNLILLQQLMNDDYRDVVVAARRRYAELTNTVNMLNTFDVKLIEEVNENDNRYNG